MKKPYKEEKTGSGTELKKLKVLLLFFLFQIQISPQIPINGFCKYNLLKTEEGFTGFFSLNFNKDTYTDLILFNPLKKEIVPLEGNFNGTFITKKIIPINHEINKVNTLTDNDNNVTGYAFTSRKGMKAGIYKFSIDGKPLLQGEVKFNSYPENISIADVDASGNKQILISGSGFNGLSLLYQKEDSLKENKIINGINFSEAILSDLNSDGFNDIAAFDFISSSLDFFYNNRYGEFRKVRSIEMEKRIFALRSLDINMDDYDDLLFQENEGISIMLGDYMSSFSDKVFIKTLYKPDKFITGDFNRDGLIDIVYMNLQESVVSVVYSKDGYEYYPEIIYLKKKGIKDLIPYYSKFISGFALINDSGEIHTVTRLTSFSIDVNISIGAKPSAISYFDIDNNGINSICFIDDYDRTAKIIRRNSSGLPSQFYSCPLYENHTEILIKNSDPFIKTFYFYSVDKKLIEVFRIDFAKNYTEKFSVYSKGKLKSIHAINRDGKDYLYTVYTKAGKPGYALFSHSEGKFSIEKQEELLPVSDISDVSLTKNFSLYLWGNNKNSVSLNTKSLDEDKSKRIFSRLYDEETYLVYSAGDILNTGDEIIVGFINSPETKSMIVASDSLISVINDKNLFDLLNIKSRDQIFIGEIRLNGLNRVNIYNPESRILYRLQFIRKGKEAIATVLAENLDIKRYFIKNMNFKSYHIVYTNRNLDCISIRKI